METMGTRIRLWEPGYVYSAVSRTVDRAFLFKPNHSRDDHLLDARCHPEALRPDNDLLPAPSIIDIIGSSIARALRAHPVDLHWAESNINHIHFGIGLHSAHIEEASRFLQHANSLIAREVNKTWDREGHVFAGPARVEPCLDDEVVPHQMVYAVTNTVKDGLVETVGESPFFSTFRHLTRGDPLRFWYIDWNAWFDAGGPRTRTHRIKDYLEWVELELAPLPGLAEMAEHRRRTWIRRHVREVEEKARKEVASAGRTFMGVPALFAVAPRGRPSNPKRSGRQPLCHTTVPALYREYRKRHRDFMDEYRKASLDYRNGDFEREFPVGSFRPPLITVYTSSAL